MLQFHVGDKAVYPTQGVAEVVGVEEKEVSGRVMRFYSLRLLATGLKILVPVDKAEQVGLRQVVGQTQVTEVLDILRDKDVPIDRQTWNRRYRGFMEKLKTGSVYELAEVYRDLSRLKTVKNLSFGERKMLDNVRGLLLKELSVASGNSELTIEQEIERVLAQ